MWFRQRHSKSSSFQVSLSLGCSCRFIKSTRNRQLFWIPSHLGNHLVTPKSTENCQLFWISSHFGIHCISSKALEIIYFSGYPLTFVSISLHQKHSKFSTFQCILSLGYPCGFIKSTQNREVFWISSHLGVQVVRPKALKILKFSSHPLASVSIWLHQKQLEFATFHDMLSLGYSYRFIKSTQNRQLFRILSRLCIHVVTPIALKFLNFSGFTLTCVCMLFHQKHSKSSTFQDILLLGYPCRYTKSTQNSQFFKSPSHLGIHLVTPKALKILNFLCHALTWVSYSLHQKYSKFSTFQDIRSLLYACRFMIGTQNSQLLRISSHWGIHVVSSNALKIVNFSGYPLAWVFISLYQKH